MPRKPKTERQADEIKNLTVRLETEIGAKLALEAQLITLRRSVGAMAIASMKVDLAKARQDADGAYRAGYRQAGIDATNHVREAAFEAERSGARFVHDGKSRVTATLAPAGFRLQAIVLRDVADSLQSLLDRAVKTST